MTKIEIRFIRNKFALLEAPNAGFRMVSYGIATRRILAEELLCLYANGEIDTAPEWAIAIVETAANETATDETADEMDVIQHMLDRATYGAVAAGRRSAKYYNLEERHLCHDHSHASDWGHRPKKGRGIGQRSLHN